MTRSSIPAAFLVLVSATGTLYGQADTGRWAVYQRFQGSSNGSGQILKLDTGVAYDLTPRVSLSAGVPYFFVRNGGDRAFHDGIGNAYFNVGLSLPDHRVRYYTSLQVSAPTGNEEGGFSTGDVTVDWMNTFSVPTERFVPFFSAGLANTVSDTSFFTRPFTSVGMVGHLQGGTLWWPGRRASIGALGYAVVPSGEQTVVSRVAVAPAETPSETQEAGTAQAPGPGGNPFGPRPNGTNASTRPKRVFETGDADLARDHGFSGWFTVYPTVNTDIYVGYSRSVRYDLDSVFLGIGWTFRGF